MNEIYEFGKFAAEYSTYIALACSLIFGSGLVCYAYSKFKGERKETIRELEKHLDDL